MTIKSPFRTALFTLTGLLLTCGLLGLALVATGYIPNPISRKVRNDPGHHNVFCCLKKARQAQPDDTIRLYIDSGGNLYPDAEFLPTNTVLRTDPGNSSADLEVFYRGPVTEREETTAHAHDRTREPLRQALYARYGQRDFIPDKTPVWDGHAWQSIQDRLVNKEAAEIDAATENGKHPLIILIHGINVADTAHLAAVSDCDNSPCPKANQAKGNCHRPVPYYTALKSLVRHQKSGVVPKDAVWLEVYWDGLREQPLFAWGAAQLSARYAGLRLREVLNKVKNTTPIRVLTHSAGGIVISQALWTNDAFNGADEDEDFIMHWASTTPTPTNPNIRVGMLVPALTSQAFFYYGQRTPPVARAQATSYRLVIGRNERDFAVSKEFVGSERFGATSMGVTSSAFNYAVQQCSLYPVDLRAVDFCTSTGKADINPLVQYGKTAYEAHDWLLYFRRETQMTAFLKDVFND